MIGFKPGSSVMGIDNAVNCATTTAKWLYYLGQWHIFISSFNILPNAQKIAKLGYIWSHCGP